MKNRTIILTAVVAAVVAFGQANAAHDGHGHDHISDKTVSPEKQLSSENIIHIEVNGLVCDFCAQSIRKVFLKTGAVEEIDVNLKRKFVTVYLKKGKDLSDKKAVKLITDSGYATVSISRYKKEGGE